MVNNLIEILNLLKGKGVCHCEGSLRSPRNLVSIKGVLCHCEPAEDGRGNPYAFLSLRGFPKGSRGNLIKKASFSIVHNDKIRDCHA